MTTRISIIIATILLSTFSATTFAQTRKTTREEYIKQYAIVAIEEMEKSGIPASITLAQGCLESGNGNSELARKANNHFGIKCKKSWKGKSMKYDDDRKNECFRKYNSALESYHDHTNFLTDNPRYSTLFTYDITDYKSWAHGLKKAGYATDPKYAHRLIKIIEENYLYNYDNPNLLAQARSIRGNIDPSKVANNLVNSPIHIIKRRNGLRSTIVKPGDTFESIANEVQIKHWEIYAYNDYNKGVAPRVNEILYLERKRNKAAKPNQTYVVKAGDSMHFISQRFGIKLKKLLRRNKMKFTTPPKVGQVIRLR
ncbi:LysM peptidoglycan-binding domain-containing protein [Puteibacter caeruleilacunae]|nr:LysM peptidoglycan-binding domain-containing protein [Puteibacter caeruleilacunae]